MPKTILLVDDDIDDLVLVQHELKSNGYEVITTTDPEEAIRKARASQPDLIILDEVMPKLFGSEVSAKLKEDPRTRDIPIVFLTSLKTPQDPSSSYSPNVVIAKSSDSTELLEAVANHL